MSFFKKIKRKKHKNGNYTLTFSRTVKLTDEDIDDIMVTALEGGSINYWVADVNVVGDVYLGECCHEYIAKGGQLEFVTFESGNCILTLDKLLSGIQLALSNGYGTDWFGKDGKFDAGFEFDAWAADVVIQFALFGDVIYA